MGDIDAPQVVVAILTRQAVGMGDHAQDLSSAVVIDPDETVGSLAARTLTKNGEWRPASDGGPLPIPDGDRYLTLRLAVAP
jgi:hypothetical protein